MTADDNDLLSEARRRLPDARNAILRAVGDMPSRGGSEGVSGGGTGEWGPTVTIAMNCHRDHAYRDLGRLTEIEWANRTNGGITRHQLRDLVDLVDRWAPDPKRKQVLEDGLRAAANDDLNYRGDINNCDSCRRDPGSYGEPFRRGLCVNCYRRVARIVELYDVEMTMPPVELVRLFRERHKVTDHDIHRVMAGQPRRA